MLEDLKVVKKLVYDQCAFQITNQSLEKESKEYQACRFDLDNIKIICRSGKITPKKVGQFVTFWKRKGDGPIEPFHENDPIDFYVINVRKDHFFGQFVIPKKVLIKKGILSSGIKDGKRGFRVYPPWDKVTSKQAEKTQKWQLNYFLAIEEALNLTKVKKLYNNNTIL